MNIPPSELQALILEYESLTFPGQHVLRTDHFFCPKNKTWLTVSVLEQDSKQHLANAEGKVLCAYDQITPLFAAAPITVSFYVQDLLDQLGDLRNRYEKEEYETAQNALQALGHPAFPFTPAYQVTKNKKSGCYRPGRNDHRPSGV